MIRIADGRFQIAAPALPAMLLHYLAQSQEDGPSRIVLRRPQPEPDDTAYRAWKSHARPLKEGYVAVDVPLPEQPADLHAVAKAAVEYADGRVWPGRESIELRWVPVDNLPALWAHLRRTR